MKDTNIPVYIVNVSLYFPLPQFCDTLEAIRMTLQSHMEARVSLLQQEQQLMGVTF